MSDLAYDVQGHPFRVPPEAHEWLVRKCRHRAKPEPVFRNGQRVTVPALGTVADVRHVVNEPGRFRLLALDGEGQPIEGVPEAYVEIDAEQATPAAFVAPDSLTTTRAALGQNPLELLLLETVRANTELARATIDRIPDIMRASAHLVSASGALPRRPMYVDDFFDDEDDDEDGDAGVPTPAPSLLDTFLRAAMMSGGNLGGFAKLLGVGSAETPASSTETTASTPAAIPQMRASTTAAAAPRNAAVPSMPANPQAHLLAILAKLSPDERGYAERVFAQLSPAAVQQWHELLLSMTVDDAVQMIRDKAAGKETEL